MQSDYDEYSRDLRREMLAGARIVVYIEVKMYRSLRNIL
jgi:hypothetical protein